MGLTRSWCVIAVVAVLLVGCGEAAGTGDDQGIAASSGDAALFCRAWPDARAALSGASTFDLLGDESVGVDQVMDYSDAYLANVDASVPAEIHTEWALAYHTYRRMSDLVWTVGFNESAINAVHMEMAFGVEGPEAAMADTEAALAAIDAWAVSECWDFCSQWPELNAILRVHGPGEWRELERNVDRYETAIEAGDLLIPAAISRYWEDAAGYVRSTFELAREFDFDPGQAGEDLDGFFSGYVGLSMDGARQAIDEPKDQISSWVEANCDTTVGAAGAPGSLTVRLTPQDHLASRQLLLALLPAGTPFAAVRSNEPFIAMTCTEADITPEDWDTMMIDLAAHAEEQGISTEDLIRDQLGEHMARPLQPTRDVGEYHQASLCNLRQHEEEAIVPGGTYELFIGSYLGDPGSFDLYLAAPERCAQIPVAVNGDTVVDLPQLSPCNLEPLGSPEEIARRTAPPMEASGSLQVQVEGALRPKGFDFCDLRAVLLPAGTTLNDIGRGDAWPSGMFTFHRPDAHEIDLGPDGQRRVSTPGLVPILAAPASGVVGDVRLSPHIEGGQPWDDRFPDPVALATGQYDLRVEELCIEDEANWTEEAEREGRRCGFIAVDVGGPTIVEMPELGACS